LLLPPLTPPVATDEDAQLRMPAIRNLLIGLDVIEAVVAALLRVGLTTQDRVLGEVPQLQRQFLVDLFGLGLGELVLVVGHAPHSSKNYPATARSSVVGAVVDGSAALAPSSAAAGAGAGAAAGRRLCGRPVPLSR